MAETSGPFDGEDFAEADFELMFADLIDGVIGSPGGAGLAAAASGTTARGVDIAAGTALTRGHWYRSDATITLTSGANGTGSARVDRGVLRLNRTANSVTMELLTGTAGAGTPALTDDATTTERPLWRWTIEPSATAVSNLIDERQWLTRPYRPCTAANRPLNPRTGDLSPETDTGNIIRFNGTTWDVVVEDTGWVPLSPAGGSSTAGPQAGAWTNNTISRVRRRNGRVHVRIAVQRWSAGGLPTSDPDGSAPLRLPAGFRPEVDEPGYGWVFSSPVGVRIEPDGDVRLFALTSTIPANGTVFAGADYIV